MNEKQFYISTEQLREEYYKRLKTPPRQRAKGIAYSYFFFIHFPLLILSILILDYLHLANIVGFILAGLFWYYLPYSFYDWKRRTTRHAFRKYPLVKSVAKRLNEKQSKFLPGLPLLNIEGKNLFLLHYGFLGWKLTLDPYESNGEINGMALVDEKGCLVEDVTLFEKAYKTKILATLGGVTMQATDGRRRAWSLNTVRRVLPKAKSILERQGKEFEQHGLRKSWENLIQNIPLLSKAMYEGLTIYEGHDRWRKAMGWSFGLKYRYEDAEEYLRMCLAYSQYMAAAYGNALVEIITTANQLMYTVSTETDWRGRKKAMWALSMLMAAAKGVESWIFTYGVLGKVTEKEMGWYRRKLNRAREIGLPIVRE